MSSTPLRAAGDMPLTDVLARLGWTVHKDGVGLKTNITTDRGERLRLRADECWALLRERGLIK
jgi:hypothetical protein